MNVDFEGINAIINRCKTKAPKAEYKCLNCKDTGFVIIKQIKGQPIIKECSCRKKDKLRQQWIDNGFNVMCNNLTFSKFDSSKNKVAKRMKEIAELFIKDFECIQFNKNNSIAFLGEAGTGKTHICTAIALELLKKDFKVVYFPYRDCIDEMIDLRISDKNQYEKKLSKYQKCSILFLDDLFKGGYTDAELKLIFKIVNYRYNNHLPIIVSSECLSDKLLEIDKAIGSRIIEMAKDMTLDIVGIEYNQRLS